MTTEPEAGDASDDASPDVNPGTRKHGRWKIALITAVLIVVGIITGTQICLFVIPPVGSTSNGVTLVVWKRGKMKSIDSADAICEREFDDATLSCRKTTLTVLVGGGAGHIARLPYNETLYLWSTGGVKYTWD
jgi:hypothetical protein